MPLAIRNLILTFLIAVTVLIVGAVQYGVDRFGDADARNAVAHGVPGRLRDFHDCSVRPASMNGDTGTWCSGVFVSDDGQLRIPWSGWGKPVRTFALDNAVYRDPGPLRYPYWARWTAGIVTVGAVIFFVLWFISVLWSNYRYDRYRSH